MLAPGWGQVTRMGSKMLGRGLALIGVCALLGGCVLPGPQEGLAPGWAAPTSMAKFAERHCYRTLAEVDCHAWPLPMEKSRRVGFFDVPLEE